MTNAETLAVGKPPLAVAQLAPPSILFKTPEPRVPAYVVDVVPGSMANATTLAPSGPIAVQRCAPATAGAAGSAVTEYNQGTWQRPQRFAGECYAWSFSVADRMALLAGSP